MVNQWAFDGLNELLMILPCQLVHGWFLNDSFFWLWIANHVGLLLLLLLLLGWHAHAQGWARHTSKDHCPTFIRLSFVVFDCLLA